MGKQDLKKQSPKESKSIDILPSMPLELLKSIYHDLHQSVWECHKIAWTVTGIFISALFAIQAYIIKEVWPLKAIQAILAFSITETLLIIWILTMVILDHYNKVRIKKLRHIESIFVKLSPGFKKEVQIYTPEYEAIPREGEISPMRIYWIIVFTFTLINLGMLLFITLNLLSITLAAIILLSLTAYYRLTQHGIIIPWDVVTYKGAFKDGKAIMATSEAKNTSQIKAIDEGCKYAVKVTVFLNGRDFRIREMQAHDMIEIDEWRKKLEDKVRQEAKQGKLETKMNKKLNELFGGS